MTQPEIAFRSTVDAAILENEDLINKGNLTDAVNNLFALEKKARMANYVDSTTRILVKIVEWCYQLQDYKALIANIRLLSKRRSQVKVSIKCAIKRCMEFLDVLPYDSKMELIDTLISVTEGKIFVEKQRARLTLKLARIREGEGKVVEAANILQEVQVETYNSMKKKEKIEYILEQMRLCILKGDYVRTQVISRKLSLRAFDESEFEELKIKYYDLMIIYYKNESNYLEIFRCYMAIYNTEIVQSDEERAKFNLAYLALYIILAPYSNEQFDLLNRISEDKRLLSLPVYYDTINKFLTVEIIHWRDLAMAIEPQLESLIPRSNGSMDSILKDLHIRVTEYNIRVVSQYYNKIHLNRLSELLDLGENETEERLSSLVLNKTIFARIDRINGIINFAKKQKTSQSMNDWANDLSLLLDLVDKTCHLIHREYMINLSSTPSL